MTYQQMIWLQGGAEILFWFCAVVGLLYLIIGLVRPAKLGLTKRRWAVLRSLAIWIFGASVLLGAIFYTHSHPRGFHSFNSYMDDFVASQCVKKGQTDLKPTLEACQKLADKCKSPGADTTHPSCVTMRQWK